MGVSYDSDPDEVERLLYEVAKDHPMVLANPTPFVYFVDFIDSALTFELRIFIRDVSKSLRVRTEVRKAIFKKFKAANIEIPFPQRDLHIRTGGVGLSD
ncbi:MAG: hypothetical protein AAGL18_07710 [Pseudomonadota bacterium]